MCHKSGPLGIDEMAYVADEACEDKWEEDQAVGRAKGRPKGKGNAKGKGGEGTSKSSGRGARPPSVARKNERAAARKASMVSRKVRRRKPESRPQRISEVPTCVRLRRSGKSVPGKRNADVPDDLPRGL